LDGNRETIATVSQYQLKRSR